MNRIFPLLFLFILCNSSNAFGHAHYSKSTSCVDYSSTLVQAADSGWYMFGNRYNNAVSRNDVVFSRFNVNGQLLWTRFFQNNSFDEYDAKVIRTRSNHLVGVSSTTALSGSGSFIFYLDTSGTIIWEKTLSVSGCLCKG